jgi:hypothetical protein
LALGLAAATLGLLSVLVLPRILIDSREAQLTAKERLDAEADVRSSLIQLIGGTVLVTGLYFTARGFRLTREGHITDRYAKAIELLGSDKLEGRIGGVYALKRLAKDSPERDSSTILEVLCAYVRVHAPWPQRDQPPQAPGGDPKPPEPSADVQAALTALGRRDRMKDEPPLDLRYTDLRGADLVRADLKGALLSAPISKAPTSGAVLTSRRRRWRAPVWMGRSSLTSSCAAPIFDVSPSAGPTLPAPTWTERILAQRPG